MHMVGARLGCKSATEMEIRCIKGIYRLKLVSSEKNLRFKKSHSLMTTLLKT